MRNAGEPGKVFSSSEAGREAHLERQLAMAQQITHIGSWEWDLRTNSVTWSEELYRIYGLEPSAHPVTFEFFVERLHPEDREHVQREIENALQRGGHFSYIERVIRPDGVIRVLETAGEVIRTNEGASIGMVGTCRDVTDDRKREEKLQMFADIVRSVPIGLSVWHVADCDDAASIRLKAGNDAAERAFGFALAPHFDRKLLEILPSSKLTALPDLLLGVARDGRPRTSLTYGFADASAPKRTFTLDAFALPAQCVGLALEETTAQTRSRELQMAEQRVLEMVARGVPLNDVLTALVLAIEEQSTGTIGSILLLDDVEKRVRHGAAPHLDPAYSQALDGFPIGPTAGSCGTAAYLRRPIFVADIEADPLWDEYRALAQPYGLRACWSSPIFANDGRVLGTFALYYREPRYPSDAEIELIARASHVAGIAIQRRELDDQLRALSARIESAREEERAGIAREIHDELGQALTALRMDLAWIERRARERTDIDRQALLDKVQTMTEMAEEVIRQVRRISSELRPGVLDDLGLSAALEWQGQEFQNRTRTTCVIRSELGDEQLDRNTSTAVFRIFQEALTNIARHARAKHVEVHLERNGGRLKLEVRDDGLGISENQLHSPRSLGLLGIRERARRIGGSATVKRDPRGGTVVRVEVPATAMRAGDTG